MSEQSNFHSDVFRQTHLICIISIILVLASHVVTAQETKKQSNGSGRENIEISQLELRATMSDFFYRFARTITESSDSIIRLSTDYAVDNAALSWKMNAIPVATGAVYNSDAFIGYIDMAVFIYQMKIFFESGAGKELFGNQQGIALRALDLLWEDLLDIGRDMVPDNDITDGTKAVTDFAEQHPISSLYFVRQSTIPLMTRIKSVEKVSFKELAVGMSESIDELSSQINAYMEVLPKQVRWESEYLINNILINPELNGRFDSLTQLLERTVVFAEASPDLIDSQRNAAFEAIRQERMAILEEIRDERAIILAELSEQITEQREASFQELNNLTNSTFNNLDELVDKLFWRAFFLISFMMILVFIGIILYKKI